MQDLFNLPSNIKTRWASAENWDAMPGEGGKANFGRKGSPCKTPLLAGETFTMAHYEDTTGIVRRMWVTISERSPEFLRGIVIRIYWDGEKKPAVEAPIGDFFCLSLGRTAPFENAWFDSPEGKSFVCRIPMPFKKSFKITASNESPKDLAMFFYDVNFTIGDQLGPDTAYFHAHYRRENPTMLRKDFAILPKVEGRGRFLGCNLGVISNTKVYSRTWWGEGEVKIYLDGDQEYPTLCGTGTEDYISTGWGQGKYAMMWHGCPIADSERMQYSFYRLHGPDPVYFYENIRVTIQQIGCANKEMMVKHMEENGIEYYVMTGDGTGRMTRQGIEDGSTWSNFEREDDWCSTAYFYLDRPANNLPPIDCYELRVTGLTGE